MSVGKITGGEGQPSQLIIFCEVFFEYFLAFLSVFTVGSMVGNEGEEDRDIHQRNQTGKVAAHYF